MTNVLHVIETLSLGGAARALMTCAAGCAASDGSRHTVVSLEPAKANGSLELARKYGLKILVAPDTDALEAVVADSDIVHVHYWNAPRIGAFLRFELPAMRLLIKFNVGGLHPPHVITRDIVDFADMIQTTGPFAHDLPVFSGLDPEVRLAKVKMSYGAADFKRLRDFKQRVHADYNVTYLGTVDFVKMHPDYVALSNAVGVPEARFIVCGSGAAFPLLERQAMELGALNRFDFRKEKEDINSLLSITDVFGYPLCEDNYSSGELVLQEVAFAGIPAVVFPYGGAGRMVVNDFTGYVVRSAPEYREALEYLHRFPKERERLGRNAREYARQLYGEENAVRVTQEIYAQLLTLPKKTRIFGAPDGDLFFQHPVRVADLLKKEIDASGSLRFIESMGDTTPWFLESLTSQDQAAQIAADERISRSSPVLIDGALFYYREYYRNDGFLRFWYGLVLEERGNPVQAAVEFIKARQAGCDNWRVNWHLARCATKFGEKTLAQDALQRVLSLNPDFREAKEAMEALADGRVPAISVQTYRMRREAFFATGELLQSEQAGKSILDLDSETVMPEDIEAYYRIGLELHKTGHVERARAVYIRVAADSRAGEELSAWAAFKHGELLLELGQEEEARRFFLQTLEFNPNHAKARIFLTPPSEPLRVCLDGKRRDGYIPVHLSPLNGELWTYYFARRSPDVICIALDIPPSGTDVVKLSELLARHLAPGGTAEILLPAETSGEVTDNSSRILEEALNSAGISPAFKRGLVTACVTEN